jgi:hypothetical protein
MGRYSKDYPKPKLGNGGSKIIAFTANLAQSERNHLIFLKRKVSKWEVLFLLDIGAFHNFITQKSAERMELQLEKLKAPIEVHFVDGIPHPTTLQARNVLLQLRNWRGKVDLLVSTFWGMECILGMEFITHNNVFIEGHNRLVRIPSKNGVIQMKAHEVPSVGGLTIHLMLGKTLKKKCMGSYGMLCVMHVLDEFEPKEATNLVSSPKCVKRVLDEFLDVMFEELPNELSLKRQIDHALKVMPKVAFSIKAPYRMSHEKLKELKVQFEELFAKGYIKPSKSPYGAPVFFVHKKDETLRMCMDYKAFKLMICLIDSWEIKCLVGLTCVSGITKFKLQKGTKKRLLVTQGMAYMFSW